MTRVNSIHPYLVPFLVVDDVDSNDTHRSCCCCCDWLLDLWPLGFGDRAVIVVVVDVVVVAPQRDRLVLASYDDFHYMRKRMVKRNRSLLSLHRPAIVSWLATEWGDRGDPHEIDVDDDSWRHDRILGAPIMSYHHRHRHLSLVAAYSLFCRCTKMKRNAFPSLCLNITVYMCHDQRQRPLLWVVRILSYILRLSGATRWVPVPWIVIADRRKIRQQQQHLPSNEHLTIDIESGRACNTLNPPTPQYTVHKV